MTEASLLRSHPFARGLSDAQVGELAPLASVVRYSAGEILFRQGEPASALYLLVSGRVVLEEHIPGQGDIALENLGAGDLLGLSWLYEGSRFLLRARAAEATEALRLEAGAVRAKMEADPSLGYAVAKHVIAQLYQRLERVRLQRLDVYRGER